MRYLPIAAAGTLLGTLLLAHGAWIALVAMCVAIEEG